MVREPHPAAKALLPFFSYEHLPAPLREVSQPFHLLAHDLASKLDGPECTVGLRKLLEAKDCMVRAALTATVRDSLPGVDAAAQG